jgi:hypothetical protein
MSMFGQTNVSVPDLHTDVRYAADLGLLIYSLLKMHMHASQHAMDSNPPCSAQLPLPQHSPAVRALVHDLHKAAHTP